MIITILVLISNYLFGQDNNSKHYKILKTIDNIEIREYNESMNISYHDESSENYFQKLANYIFGGNDKNQNVLATENKQIPVNGSGSLGDLFLVMIVE